MQHKKFRGLAALALSVMLMAPSIAIANATEPTPDTTAPRLLVKPGLTESCPTDVSNTQSFALRDNVGVKGTHLNGVRKDVTPNKFSDYNGIMVGKGGAVDGSNTIAVEDTSGNKSTPCTFVLDGTGPIITPRSAVGANGVYVKVSYGFEDKWSQVDRAAINGNPINLSNNKYSNLDNLHAGDWYGTREGSNTLQVWDIFGNVTSLTYVIDKTAPAISWVTPNEDSFLRGTVPVTVSVNDNHPLAYNLRVNAAGLSYANPYVNGNQTFLWNTTTVADGRHKLYAAATDRATNKSEAFRFVTVDNTNPVATVDSPADGTLVKGSVSVNLTATDTNLVAYSYRIKPVNGGATVVDKVINSTTGLNNESALIWDTPAFANGEYFVYVSGRDAAGNRAEQRIFVEVDNTVVVEPEEPVVTEPEPEPQPEPEPPTEEETNPVTNPEEAPTKEKDADVTTPVKEESKLNVDGAHLISAPAAMKTIAPLEQLAATGPISPLAIGAYASALLVAGGVLIVAARRRARVEA